MDASERSERLQRVCEAQTNRELASRYDEWAQDYEDDMLRMGYAIPAVAAGFVGRHVPPHGTVLDAGAGTGMFGTILGVLGYEDLVGIDISERMLEKAGEKNAYRGLHRMVLGEPLGFDDGSFSAAVSVGVFTTNQRPARGARRARAGHRNERLDELQYPQQRVREGGFRGEAGGFG